MTHAAIAVPERITWKIRTAPTMFVSTKEFGYTHQGKGYFFLLIFWGNSSNRKKTFTLQKIIIRIMVGAHPRTSCRRLFKKSEILTVPNQYIYSLISFFIENQEKFPTNSSVHNINTRNKHHFHRPVANLSFFQKGAS